MWIYYLKLSVLSIKKTPVLSLLMVLAIAIGIAACLTTLTMYSVVSSNPLAHKNETIYAVQLDSWDPNREYFRGNNIPLQVTYQDAVALYESGIPDQTVVMRASGMTTQKADMTGDTSVEATRMTTRAFFDMFDVEFIYGGSWSENADINAEKVVVINEDLNNQLFEGKDSIGEPLLLEKEVFTIVGVVASDWNMVPTVFDLNNGSFGRMSRMYIPFFNVNNKRYQGWGNFNGWSSKPQNSYQDFLQSETVWLQMWVELSSQNKKAAFSQFIEAYITQQKQNGRFQRPLEYLLNTPEEWLEINEVVSSDNRQLVALSITFLVVCLINTIMMLLAKFLRKAPEAGVRRALGASRSAIFSQHLYESLAIGVIGGLFGLVLSWFGLAGIRELYGDYNQVAVLNTYTVVMALVLAVVASLFSGALPAWRISHTQPATYLNTQ